MKLLFQCEQLNHRGTTNSTVDYALYNQQILGNQSTIAYCSVDPPGFDVGTKPEIVEQLKQHFNIITYETEEDLNRIAADYDFCYSQRAGYLHEPDTKKKLAEVKTTKFGVHCVFQWYEPHGDAYAYISEWLASSIFFSYKPPEKQKYVPYIVDLPQPNLNLREQLGISKDKFVIGRHGGYNTFDVNFAKHAVYEVASIRDDFVFLFCNTAPFCDLPNVKFLPPFFGQQEKSNYINACDAMLHARDLGESFGLSVAEFLYFNKPVLSWGGGFDRNHVNWLQRHDLIYKDKEDLIQRLHHLRSRVGADYNSIVSDYNPTNVMKLFKEVYLSVAP